MDLQTLGAIGGILALLITLVIVILQFGLQNVMKSVLNVLAVIALLAVTGGALWWFFSQQSTPPGYGSPGASVSTPTASQWAPRQSSVLPTTKDAPAPATQPFPGQPRPFTNSADMDFVWLDPGSFQMGSPKEEPGHDKDEVQHRVTLTKGLWMQTTLVTQKQWKAVMGKDTNPSHFKGDDLPVDTVSWKDAKELFCTKLNAKENREQEDQKYRLPCEAEWEYAARAGKPTPFWQGESITKNDANFGGHYGTTTPVKQFPANPWRLHDMGGNLWQWCEDWYTVDLTGYIKYPKGPENGTRRVLRGGSWGSYAWYCRVANRDSDDPDNRCGHWGFRVVLPAGARTP